MIHVTLCAGSGECVAEVLIPHFHKMPDVLVFGTRHFTHYGYRQYRECFCYTILPELHSEHHEKSE